MEESNRIDLPVTGMTCAACSTRVQNTLSKLNGVESAAVNLAAERATVFYKTSEVSVDKLMETIKDLGYGVSVSKVILPIKGMTCASCVNKVQNTLSSLSGVISASVNFATEKATVEYLPSQIGMREFKKAVRDSGYDILELEQGEDIVEKEKEERERDYRKLRNKLITGAVLTVPIFLIALWEKLGLSSFLEIPRQTGFLIQLIIQTPV